MSYILKLLATKKGGNNPPVIFKAEHPSPIKPYQLPYKIQTPPKQPYGTSNDPLNDASVMT